MGKCQRATAKGRGGVNCRRNAVPGTRYCARHSGAKPTRKHSPRRGGGNSNNGCALLVLVFVTVAVALGLLV